ESGNYDLARLRADERAGRLGRIVVLQCQRTLPAKKEVALVWGAGIAAPNGVAARADQALNFETRPDFTARFACDRLHARSGCIPFLPMSLNFSAPVAARDAAGIYLEGADGKRYPARVQSNGTRVETVEDIGFAGPFPER